MGRIEALMDDLALQKKRLEDMRAWESSDVLVRAQITTIEILEKRIEEIKSVEKPAGKPELEIDAVMEPHRPGIGTDTK